MVENKPTSLIYYWSSAVFGNGVKWLAKQQNVREIIQTYLSEKKTLLTLTPDQALRPGQVDSVPAGVLQGSQGDCIHSDGGWVPQ